MYRFLYGMAIVCSVVALGVVATSFIGHSSNPLEPTVPLGLIVFSLLSIFAGNALKNRTKGHR